MVFGENSSAGLLPPDKLSTFDREGDTFGVLDLDTPISLLSGMEKPGGVVGGCIEPPELLSLVVLVPGFERLSDLTGGSIDPPALFTPGSENPRG